MMKLCNIHRQGDEWYCFTCNKRWSVKDASPCDTDDTTGNGSVRERSVDDPVQGATGIPGVSDGRLPNEDTEFGSDDGHVGQTVIAFCIDGRTGERVTAIQMFIFEGYSRLPGFSIVGNVQQPRLVLNFVACQHIFEMTQR